MPSLASKYTEFLEQIVTKYDQRVAREITRAMRQAGKQLADPLGDNNWVQRHTETIGKILLSEWQESARLHVRKLISDTKSSPTQMERKEAIDWQELYNPAAVNNAIADWVASFGGQKITEIVKTTQKDINAIVAMAEREGLSERETGRLIYEVAPTKSASRSQTIARTEAHGVGQGVSLEVAKATGVQMVKVWIANENDRTREAHTEADGQRRPLDGKFEVDGELLSYAGDPAGSAANIVNCRCVTAYDVA